MNRTYPTGVIMFLCAIWAIPISGNAQAVNCHDTSRSFIDSFCTKIAPLAANNPPVVANGIPPISVERGQELQANMEAGAEAVFSDPDGDTLTYTASSDNTAVATAAVSALDRARIVLTGVSDGMANITVTASDGRGGAVSDSFVLTVFSPTQQPEVVRPVPDQTVGVGETVTVELAAPGAEVFRDPEGATLTYDYRNFAAAYATVAVEGSRLTIAGVKPGSGRAWALASDGFKSALSEFRVTVTDKASLETALAGVARTTVAGATDVIRLRFDSAPGASALSIAGRPVGGAQGFAAPGTGRPDRSGPAARAVSGATLLGGSAFTLPLGGDGTAAGGETEWTVWGRGDWRGFEGPTGTGGYDGAQRAGWLGLDARLDERLLAGLGLSLSVGETDYRMGADRGHLETRLTALWPYAQMETDGGGKLRLVLGAGQGELKRHPAIGPSERADLTMLAVSVGGRMPAARRDGFTLSALGNASLAQIETDGASSAPSIGGLTASSWHLRGGVEAEHDGVALSGSALTLAPRGGLALRRDGGDGVTGAGMEVSGGARLAASGSRFSLDASAHWLALHSRSGVREWGANLEARLKPGADGRGLSLAFGPAWGRDGTPDREEFSRPEAVAAASGLSFDARAGFGFGIEGGRLTPQAFLRLEEDRRRTGAGVALDLDAGGRLALTAERRHADEARAEDRIRLELRLAL